MARKDAIMYLVDVSKTMGGPCLSHGQANDVSTVEGEAPPIKTTTRLDLVRQGVVTDLLQRAVDKPKGSEVGVIIYGSDTTDNLVHAMMDEDDKKDYLHVHELVSLQNPKVEMASLVDDTLKQATLRNADLVAGEVFIRKLHELFLGWPTMLFPPRH